MPPIEDLLRDELKRVADTVQPGQLRPLQVPVPAAPLAPPPAPGRRRGRGHSRRRGRGAGGRTQAGPALGAGSGGHTALLPHVYLRRRPVSSRVCR